MTNECLLFADFALFGLARRTSKRTNDLYIDVLTTSILNGAGVLNTCFQGSKESSVATIPVPRLPGFSMIREVRIASRDERSQ